MASEASSSKKAKPISRRLRHQPPPVDHLPWAKAQKVKREWVKEKMIRRAYFHEKKKMGLVPAMTGANIGAEDSGWPRKRRRVVGDISAGKAEEQDTAPRTLGADRRLVAETMQDERLRRRKEPAAGISDSAGPLVAAMGSPEDQNAEIRSQNAGHEHLSPVIAPSSINRSPKKRPRDGDRDRSEPSTGTTGEGSTLQSLRDLTRKAYSRSSLHTYKSEPMGRKSRDDLNRKPSGPRVKATNAKGQPNMKLRMEAMLERIQRTMSR